MLAPEVQVSSGSDQERLERVARLAGEVAHDLNNVLTVLLSAGEAIRGAVVLGALPAPDDVEQLVAAGARARALNERLLESARGGGSPSPLAPGRSPSAPPAPEQARGGSETILLVEDDAAVRRQVLRTLAGAGYRVHVAEGGHEALGWAAELASVPDLLITDMVMPRVDGARLAGALRAHWPRLRVLVVSGYLEDELPAHLAPPRAQLLHKPFSAAGLLARVRQVLDAA